MTRKEKVADTIQKYISGYVCPGLDFIRVLYMLTIILPLELALALAK